MAVRSEMQILRANFYAAATRLPRYPLAAFSLFAARRVRAVSCPLSPALSDVTYAALPLFPRAPLPYEAAKKRAKSSSMLAW